MGMYDYIHARRLGLRSYNANIQARKSPYLPALDELVPDLDVLARVPLGLIQIPLNRTVGASMKSRVSAFAPNFMPILETNSEFSGKWSRLYDSVVKDGLREPVKALEYLNEYYIIEGNKRVSVMKYLDAVFVEAEVTRVMPRPSDEKVNRVYYEFLTFYADTAINYIWFSQESSFRRLYELTGHTPGVKWSSEDKMDLHAAYMSFRNEYKALTADSINITTGDAFLIYVTIFGYQGVLKKTSAEIQEAIRQLHNEFERTGNDDAVSLIMDPVETPRTLLSALFGPTSVKAAFLFHHSPQESGWNYWHNLGRINAENALGSKLESTVRVLEDPDTFESEIEQLIRDGNRVIFATSPVLLDASIKPSLEHPEVKILCCSLLASYYHVRSYYLRMYEVKFLIGMIAGALAENDSIGYIADYPIYGAPASINAFALGARMVNPRAKVYLEWSTKKDFDPDDPFGGKDVRVISNRDINAPAHSSKEYGLYHIKDGAVHNLAIPLLDWSRFYEFIISSVLAGTFESVSQGASALNYWWGMSSDALDLIMSSHFDPYLKRLICAVKASMQSDQFWPFEGELRSQDGELRCAPDERLSPAQIICMDWLADNIIGDIPDTSELRDSAKPIMQQQGIDMVTPPDISTFNWRYNQ